MRKIHTAILILLFGAVSVFCEGRGEAASAGDALPIPPELTGSKLRLEAGEGELKLPFGTSSTYGYNGDYLGPTLRVSREDFVEFQIENKLPESTTVHWHGLHVPAEFDGGPHQVIKAGETWEPEFVINQPAATLWYHPHLMGKTAEHVYKGLAGLFIIDDEYSRALPIPKTYGINDIPLIFQDRDFDGQGRFDYRPGRPDLMHGYIGNAVLVNGAYLPELKLDKGTYRFRLLNGSNSSIYRFSFKDSRTFTVIASDGGFLPESVKTDKIIISPGERFEILIDFSIPEEAVLNLEIYGSEPHKVMTVNVGSNRGEFFPHPAEFKYEPEDFSSADLKERDFIMETRGMGIFTINGRQMDMDVLNFTLDKDSKERWFVANRGMGMMNIPHSFHVHDTQFKVLSFNGQPPPALYAGPKDTILLMPGDRAVIGVSFKDYTGIYMYHCHLLEHEDSGMMGQFMIE